MSQCLENVAGRFLTIVVQVLKTWCDAGPAESSVKGEGKERGLKVGAFRSVKADNKGNGVALQ